MPEVTEYTHLPARSGVRREEARVVRNPEVVADRSAGPQARAFGPSWR